MRYITSFSRDGYELYGKTFLETFRKYHDESLTVYSEDIEELWAKKLPGVEFIEQHQGIPAFNGLELNGKRNYRFDVVRFCRKSFAQIDAAKQPLVGPLVWIDADIEFRGRLPAPKFDGNFMCYLGRPDWHSCASYVAWDLDHHQNAMFWDIYERLYTTGTVFRLPEWHDSYILDYIRKSLNLEAKNLAEPHSAHLKGPANVFNYVFPMGNHKKGNLKFK